MTSIKNLRKGSVIKLTGTVERLFSSSLYIRMTGDGAGDPYTVISLKALENAEIVSQPSVTLTREQAEDERNRSIPLSSI